jgi:gamma-butyrobetaine dioxygenase
VSAGAPIELIEALFADKAGTAYLGEQVTTAEHLLQAATCAEELDLGDALIVAALLHDVGHFLVSSSSGPPIVASAAALDGDRPLDHAADGAAWLAQWFAPAVTEPVRLHVEAKRYLCQREPAYAASLSPASVRSLGLQGGPMDVAHAATFSEAPHSADAVALRRCDDWAKTPGFGTPDLDHFLSYVRAELR